MKVALFIFCLLLGLTACSEKQPTHQADSRRWAALARGTVDVPGGLLHLQFPQDGVVESVAVVEGQTVAQGDILARLDENAARLAVETAAGELAEAEIPLAQSQQEAAEREVRRLEALAANHLATTQSLEQAKDHLAEARAQVVRRQTSIATRKTALEVARYEQSLRTLRSPVDGTIVQGAIQPGETVSNVNPKPLFIIAPQGPRIIRAEIEEDALANIRVGQKAEIVDEMQRQPPVAARLQRIGLQFGSQKIGLDEPSQPQDRHVVECILELQGTSPFLLGQRVLVRFLPISDKKSTTP